MPANDELRRDFARLEAARADFVHRLAAHDAQALNRSPSPGRWSPVQVAHHVIASEEATLRYVRRKMQGGDALPRAGLAGPLKIVGLRAVLASPLRLRAPAVTAAVPVTSTVEEVAGRWDAARGEWRALIDGFPPALADRLVFRHPFVGLLSLRDTLGFLDAHLRHHARQAARALPPRPGRG
jgi:hypothetical protein